MIIQSNNKKTLVNSECVSSIEVQDDAVGYNVVAICDGSEVLLAKYEKEYNAVEALSFISFAISHLDEGSTRMPDEADIEIKARINAGEITKEEAIRKLLERMSNGERPIGSPYNPVCPEEFFEKISREV